MFVFFYLKNSQSSSFSFFSFELYSVFYGTTTKCAERVTSDLTVLEVKTQERKSLGQINQRLTFTFQWKSNKQRCNCERMRDKDVKFIHIISIVTVVYNNGINLKILMSHQRHLTTTFKLPHVQCCLPTSKFTSNSPQIPTNPKTKPRNI